MSGAITSLKVVRQTNKVNTGTVIFFHGSGDTGSGYHDWIQMLIGSVAFPHLKCVFPTAPIRNYTPNNGAPSHVWFDRFGISPKEPEHLATLDSINYEVRNLINKELDSGIPLNKIIVGGFSMGGALALHTAYRNILGLAGVFALSSFLNDNSVVYESLIRNPAKAKTPLLMFHGNQDALVNLSWGQDTYNLLTKLGVEGKFNIVDDCFHEMKTLEIRKLYKWINTIIPEESEEK